jgi:hypothetical protein
LGPSGHRPTQFSWQRPEFCEGTWWVTLATRDKIARCRTLRRNAERNPRHALPRLQIRTSNPVRVRSKRRARLSLQCDGQPTRVTQPCQGLVVRWEGDYEGCSVGYYPCSSDGDSGTLMGFLLRGLPVENSPPRLSHGPIMEISEWGPFDGLNSRPFLYLA